MNSNQANQDVFTFGVEIETLLRPNNLGTQVLRKLGFNPQAVSDTNSRRQNRNLIRLSIRNALEAANIPAVAVDNPEDLEYNVWNITFDGSIVENYPNAPWDGYYGVELVSRIYFSNSQKWQSDITKIWEQLDAWFDVKLHVSCGTHVHISPINGFSLEQAKSLAKGVLYYESSIEALVPQERRGNNIWANRNTSTSKELTTLASKAIKSKDWSQVFQYIDKHQSFANLINTISPRKSLAWNFNNLLKNCGTKLYCRGFRRLY